MNERERLTSEAPADEPRLVVARRGFGRDERGTTAAEYAVMLSLILGVLIVVISSVGGSSSDKWFNNANDIISAIQ